MSLSLTGSSPLQNLPLPIDAATLALLFISDTLSFALPVLSLLPHYLAVPYFLCPAYSYLPLKSRCSLFQEAFPDIPLSIPSTPGWVVYSSSVLPQLPMLSSLRILIMLGFNYWLNSFSLLDCELLKNMDSIILPSFSPASSEEPTSEENQGMFKWIILKRGGFYIYWIYTCQMHFNFSSYLWLRAVFVGGRALVSVNWKGKLRLNYYKWITQDYKAIRSEFE